MAGVVGFPYIVPSSALGGDGAVAPGNRITMGLIGTGSINIRHRKVFLTQKEARIVAVCDPVKSRREPFRDHINQDSHRRNCDRQSHRRSEICDRP